MSTLEICIDSVAGAKAAQSAGVHRVELCANLLEGGITPSNGLIKQVRSCFTGALMVLIRPRGGDFVYDEDEMAVMLEDIAACKALGADGVVLGCLAVDGQVDAAATSTLVQAAKQHVLDITFHRAFDVCRDLSEALEVIISLGVQRVLTSGGQPSAKQGSAVLAALVAQAAGRCSIMAGGGITTDNAAAVLAETGVRELHSSAKRKHHSPMQYRSPNLTMSSQTPPNDYVWNTTDASEVERLLHIMCAAGRTQAC